jgi:hypothetical protein
VPKIKPGRFKNVEEFAMYCREVVRRHGEQSVLQIRWSGPPPRRGRKEIGIGLYAEHLQACPDQPGWQIYAVNARDFSNCVDRGGLIESHKQPFPPPTPS